MRRFVVVLAGGQRFVGVNEDIDILGETVDQSIAFGQRRAALEREDESELLQAHRACMIQ